MAELRESIQISRIFELYELVSILVMIPPNPSIEVVLFLSKQLNDEWEPTIDDLTVFLFESMFALGTTSHRGFQSPLGILHSGKLT